MDSFVKNFIASSIIYLALSSMLGVVMMAHPNTLGTFKFVHSHLMLLGWVSMMIYGVGYHILPRFAGKLIKNKALPEFHFWVANAALIGMVVCYPMYMSTGEGIYKTIMAISGTVQALSMFIFLYVMFVTLYSKDA